MAQQSAGMPYIGSLISLISKTGVRYEGTLYTIDMVESTIALQNGTATARRNRSLLCSNAQQRVCLAVHSFGTEGRKQDGPQIPASERPFEFIIFRGDCRKASRRPAAPGTVDRTACSLSRLSLLCASAGTDIADLTVITNGPPEGQQVT